MRLFAICPRIRKNSGSIIASTAWRVQVVLLGMLYRRVEIEPASKSILMVSRYLWLIRRRRTIRFADVHAVTYGYEDLSGEAAYFSYGHDSFDWFTVGLRLHDDTELHLFNFLGDGTYTNHGPLPDWVYWDEFTFNITGSQEKESRVFVDLLAKMLDVKVVPPRRY